MEDSSKGEATRLQTSLLNERGTKLLFERVGPPHESGHGEAGGTYVKLIVPISRDSCLSIGLAHFFSCLFLGKELSSLDCFQVQVQYNRLRADVCQIFFLNLRYVPRISLT